MTERPIPIAQLAERLGVTHQAVRYWITRGCPWELLASDGPGPAWVVAMHPADVRRWLEERQQARDAARLEVVECDDVPPEGARISGGGER